MERNPEFFKGLGQGRVNLFRAVFVLTRRCVVDDILIVHFREVQMGPRRLFHLLPFPEGVQPELQQPCGLLLPAGNQADDLFVEALRDQFLLHLRHEPLFVLPPGKFLYDMLVFVHKYAKIADFFVFLPL